jgi:hypothetical protein
MVLAANPSATPQIVLPICQVPPLGHSPSFLPCVPVLWPPRGHSKCDLISMTSNWTRGTLFIRGRARLDELDCRQLHGTPLEQYLSRDAAHNPPSSTCAGLAPSMSPSSIFFLLTIRQRASTILCQQRRATINSTIPSSPALENPKR